MLEPEPRMRRMGVEDMLGFGGHEDKLNPDMYI
jgi:hypothetical protein